MSAPPGLTALVLAGSRAGGDALAAHAGVSHKALIEIAGRTMLERVLTALAASPEIARIVVAIERPEIVAALPQLGKPVVSMAAAAGPSASVAAAMQTLGTPLLVTTADHALLEPQWVAEFLAGAPNAADAIVALARREAIHAALASAPDGRAAAPDAHAGMPETERTYLHFSDGDYSGCNLFLLRSPAAAGIVRLWQQIEADRKRPLAMLQRLGLTYALRYRLRQLSLESALARLGELSGAKISSVVLRSGLSAIDVDKATDLELVRRLLA